MKKLIFFLALLPISLLHGQTTISQDIISHTTWNLAGSPYTLSNTVKVDSGVVLTIDPGVEVHFMASRSLEVNGSLLAVGTPVDSIRFLGTGSNNNIKFTGLIEVAYINMTEMQSGFGTNLQAANIPHHPNGPGIEVRHARFFDNWTALSNKAFGGPMGIIDSCVFIDCYQTITGDEWHISHSIFAENAFGISFSKNSLVEFCTFYTHTFEAVRIVTPGIFRNCEVYDNPTGIYIHLSSQNMPGQIRIEDNYIHHNEIGIYTFRDTFLSHFSLNPIFSGNTICNDSINIQYRGPATAGALFPNVDIMDNCWCEWDSASVDSTILNYTVDSLIFMPFDSTCLPSLVFPGDANHDQVANNFDLLPIGIHFNQTGPLRPSANLSWMGQRCADWSGLQANGRNIKHVDTDGNGTVNFDDTLAINQHYGLTHNSWRGAASGSFALGFQMPIDNILPGDTLTIPILLGTVDTPAVGMYGLAFSIHYDSMMIEPNSVKIRYDGSWLGAKNNDILTLDKDFFLEGQTDLALVRNNQMNRTGYGKIADIIVVISDDLAKRELPLALTFSNAGAVDSAGNPIALTTFSGTSTIDTDPINSVASSFAFDLKVYPNPAKDKLILEHETFTFTGATLVSITGQKTSLWKGYQTKKVTLPLPAISQGIYMLEVEMKEGRKVLKIEIR